MMKLGSVVWLLRYRLMRPILNTVTSFYNRCYWLIVYPLYKALFSVAWIIRWRIIQGLVNVVTSWVWMLRWRIGYPLIKKYYSLVWIMRWRVIGVIVDRLRAWQWMLRWRVFHPIGKKLYSVIWVVRWRIIRRMADNFRTWLWILRWRIVHPIVKKLYSAVWVIRWRILRPSLNYFQYLVWYARWKLIYPVLKSVVPTAVLRLLYPARARGIVQFLKDLRIQSIPLRSFGQYSAQCNVMPCEVVEPVAVDTPAPRVFPLEDNNFLVPISLGFLFPAVSVIALESATVFGRSNMVFARNTLFHHDLYQFSHDFTSEELHGKIRVLPIKKLVKQYETVTREVYYPLAALFLDSCSSNYAHWLTEVLPRIHVFSNGFTQRSSIVGEQDPAARVYPSIPLLIDAGLHANIEASLLAVVGESAQVVRVANCTTVLVDKLLVTTPTGYVPFDRRSSNQQGNNEGVFSSKALQSLRSHLSSVLPRPLSNMPKRIFLKRNTKARSMLNADDIEKRLVTQGFEAVSTELMSFAEQFHLFAAVDTVVGATGAAFANLIFCKPTAKIIICIAKFENTSYGYWQNLACASGNQVSYVFGKIAPTLVKSIHSDFVVDELDVLKAIK